MTPEPHRDGQTVECRCGERIAIWLGQCGEVLKCPQCSGSVRVPPLSAFPQSIPSTARSGHRFQFSLRTLFALMLLFAVGGYAALVSWRTVSSLSRFESFEIDSGVIGSKHFNDGSYLLKARNVLVSDVLTFISKEIGKPVVLEDPMQNARGISVNIVGLDWHEILNKAAKQLKTVVRYDASDGRFVLVPSQ